MKSIKTALLSFIASVLRSLDANPKARCKAFTYGFLSRVPRFIRRLTAGSDLHRIWLRGSMTKMYDIDGNCFASEGRKLPFKIDPRDYPTPVPPEFYLFLCTALKLVLSVSFWLSLRPFEG